MSVSLSVSIYLQICLPLCPCDCLSTCLSVFLSVCMRHSVSLSLSLSIHLHVCGASIFNFLSVAHLSLSLSAYLSTKAISKDSEGETRHTPPHWLNCGTQTRSAQLTVQEKWWRNQPDGCCPITKQNYKPRRIWRNWISLLESVRKPDAAAFSGTDVFWGGVIVRVQDKQRHVVIRCGTLILPSLITTCTELCPGELQGTRLESCEGKWTAPESY